MYIYEILALGDKAATPANIWNPEKGTQGRASSASRLGGGGESMSRAS